MIPEVEEKGVAEFLTLVSAMSVEQFNTVRRYSINSFNVRDAARPLIALGGADFRHLDKLVRDTVGPLLVSLDWPDTRVSARAVGLVLDAAQATLRRDKLTAEQYEAFVGGFRQVGVTVPDHRPAG